MLDAASLIEKGQFELLPEFTKGLGDCQKVVDASIVKISKNSLGILNKFLKKMRKTSETIEKDILPSSQYDEQFKMAAREDNEKLREILQQAEKLFQKAQSVYIEMDMRQYNDKAVKKLKLPTSIVSKTKEFFSKIGLKKAQAKEEIIEKEDREQLARELEAKAFEAKASEALKTKESPTDLEKEVKTEVSSTIQQIQAAHEPVKEVDERMQQRLNKLMPKGEPRKPQAATVTDDKNKSKPLGNVDEFLDQIRKSSKTVENPLKSIEKGAILKPEVTTEDVEKKKKVQPEPTLYDRMMANFEIMHKTPELEAVSSRNSYIYQDGELRSTQAPRFIHPIDKPEYELNSVEEEKPIIADVPISNDEEEMNRIIETSEKKDDSSSIMKRKLEELRMSKEKPSADSFVEKQMRKDPIGNFVKSGGAGLLRRASEVENYKESDKNEEDLKAALRRIEETLKQETDSLPREVREALEEAATATNEALQTKRKATDLGATTQRITIQVERTSDELKRLQEEYDKKMDELKNFAAGIKTMAAQVKSREQARQEVYTQDLTLGNKKIDEYQRELDELRGKKDALLDAIDKTKETYEKFSATSGIKR